MKRFFDPCWPHRQNISLLAARALPETEEGQLKIHLAACADCRKYFAEVKAVTLSLKNLSERLPQFQPSQLAQARWSKAIQTAGRPETVHRLTPTTAFRGWWHDVIWPHRRVWAGLAAIWVIILAGNLSLPGHEQSLAGKSSPQEMITTFKNQQRILAELLTDHVPPQEMEPPKTISPRPRTEISMTMTT